MARPDRPLPPRRFASGAATVGGPALTLGVGEFAPATTLTFAHEFGVILQASNKRNMEAFFVVIGFLVLNGIIFLMLFGILDEYQDKYTHREIVLPAFIMSTGLITAVVLPIYFGLSDNYSVFTLYFGSLITFFGIATTLKAFDDDLEFFGFAAGSLGFALIIQFVIIGRVHLWRTEFPDYEHIELLVSGVSVGLGLLFLFMLGIAATFFVADLAKRLNNSNSDSIRKVSSIIGLVITFFEAVVSIISFALRILNKLPV